MHENGSIRRIATLIKFESIQVSEYTISGWANKKNICVLSTYQNESSHL